MINKNLILGQRNLSKQCLLRFLCLNIKIRPPHLPQSASKCSMKLLFFGSKDYTKELETDECTDYKKKRLDYAELSSLSIFTQVLFQDVLNGVW